MWTRTWTGKQTGMLDGPGAPHTYVRQMFFCSWCRMATSVTMGRAWQSRGPSDDDCPGKGRVASVRSVIIFLHGEKQCRQVIARCPNIAHDALFAACPDSQVDILMERDVVSSYCVPIMVPGPALPGNGVSDNSRPDAI